MYSPLKYKHSPFFTGVEPERPFLAVFKGGWLESGGVGGGRCWRQMQCRLALALALAVCALGRGAPPIGHESLPGCRHRLLQGARSRPI